MSAPANQATFGQFRQVEQFILSLFGDNPTTEEVQRFLAAGDLFKLMSGADLSKVDRGAFKALLTPPRPPIPWTAVSEYASRIAARNELRGWKLPKKQLDALKAQLESLDHASDFQPVGISMWLGQDLAYNRAEAIAWLKDVVEAKGLTFGDYTGEGRTGFYQGSEQLGSKVVSACGLDLGLWRPTEGIVPKEVRDAYPDTRWPGLELFWLMALNPDVYLGIDYENIPGLLAPGLVVGSGYLPYFDRFEREVWVDVVSANDRWSEYFFVAFREL